RQAEALFAHLDDLGHGSMLDGVITGIEENWFQRRIADSAYELERRFNSGERIVVGVNAFTDGNDDDDLALLRITNADEERQRKRLDMVRHDRDQTAVDTAIDRLRREAADPEINLMPALIEASTVYVTLGEMMRAMGDVFGRHTEVPTI
ncbi:MAG: methylmalonyl-CoA mutase family protein, partial [Ilumatobacteraceae bacterium]